MELWTLKGKKFLVIDDFPEMRSMLKSMLVAYGAEDIIQGKNGEEGIDLLAEHKFDIILCDYNLGEGKDGQQMLEEAKYRELLPLATIFVMVTAENTTEMVMGALEYQPDDYLSKPINKTVLQARLKKLIEKKQQLVEISKAIERKQYDKAIELCDEKLKEGGKYQLELKKLKCDMLFKLDDYDAIKVICEEILEDHEIPWALLDLGKVHYFKQKYDDAIECFDNIINLNKSFTAAYDWQAKAYNKLGETDEAQKALMEAAEISPKSIFRQRELADVAFKNEDYETTEKARKQAISVSKNSVLRKPSDFSGLAKVLVKNDKVKDALKVAGNIKNEFKKSDEAMLEASLTEGLIYQETGNDKKAKEALDMAVSLYEKNPNAVSSESSMELAKVCMGQGDDEKANEILKNVVRNYHDDKEMLEKVDQVYQEAGHEAEGQEIINATRQEVIDLNNQGVGLAEQGKLNESIELFTKAIKGLPNNHVINMNAAQSLIMLMQKEGVKKRRLAQAIAYLDVARDVDEAREKYNKLMDLCKKLANSAA